MKRVNIDSREDWLNAAVLALRPIFAEAGYPLADKIRVSCGWPGGRNKARAIGQCWTHECSADGTFELFLSPVLAEVDRVLDVLVHELCHVAVGIAAGHRAAFAKCAKALRLKGPWKATTATPEFASEIAVPVLAFIGCAYPHAAMNSMAAHTGPRKQGTRMLKAECPDCGYTCRTTAKWLQSHGAPLCPCNQEAMEVKS